MGLQMERELVSMGVRSWKKFNQQIQDVRLTKGTLQQSGNGDVGKMGNTQSSQLIALYST
ncbi:hypothetical protein Fmac_024218 [Flemingia macrophylla]|uniref:Uncharacterized protein n=1 Tax=Flemingia macrophylla TaxID=520843 RepID=A0ABD1LQI6_9FABA